MQQREKFSSRLGFILISAGCAIGLGNVYRFPIITGAYGGALFVLFYILFLLDICHMNIVYMFVCQCSRNIHLHIMYNSLLFDLL